MIDKKAIIQELNYKALTHSNINKIVARYLAFKFADMGVEIQEVKNINELEYKISCVNSCYKVTLPQIPIPDAKIELM